MDIRPFRCGASTVGKKSVALSISFGLNIFHSDTSNGGYPAQAYKRPNWGVIDAVKLRQVYRINVNIMQQAGPRLVEGLQCLAQIIHPDRFSGALPAYCTGTV